MPDQSNLQKRTLPQPSRWRVYVAYILFGLGSLTILTVCTGWLHKSVPALPIPQVTQLGILVIWTGILFRQTAKTYFSVISSLTLILSLMGFADNLIYDVDQPSNRDPKFIVHGLFCFAWMIAFAVQADLVRTGKRELHQRVGMAGFVAAIGFTASTIYVFYAIWKPWGDMLNRAQINRILLPSFAVLILLSWIYRRRPEHHKRMILMGTLYLMQPIIARAVSGFLPAHVIVWSGLFVSLFVYDWVVLRRFHPVTYLGATWFLLAWGIVAQS